MRTCSWKETLIRAGRTFLQAFVPTFSAGLVGVSTGLLDINTIGSVLLSLLISAVAAGLAALMNLPVKKEDRQ